ncbi:hypothetical protein RND81_07G121500 [Saponaria officinalis]|uniref:BED-type domain-containing protein n=1 Tax=Saponaria officinalis TaxID=3572 RepID=A0AAW1JR25_SAPOF
MDTSSSASAPSNNDPLNLVGEEDVANEQPPNNVESIAPSQTKGKVTKRASTSTNTDDSAGGVAKKSKKRSWLWDHFNEVIIDGKKRAGCRYCTSNVCGDSKSGTSVMKNHLERCLEYPPNIDKSQKLLALHNDLTTKGEGASGSNTHDKTIIGKAIENCLIECGITTKVLTVTVDNDSANDVGVDYLRERLSSWNGTILEGNFLQMRCAAHILSLTVKEGLKEADDSIYRIRNAVRFVRSSPARLLKFNACVKKEQIDSNRHLCLDVETRWNSTYLMLESALIYRKAFLKLEISDGGKFRAELNKNRGTPVNGDWERVSHLLPFLKKFYDATLRLSASLYTTTNVYLQEVVVMLVCLMTSGMKRKHDKYWENVDKVNLLLYIAVILDPRRKMQYVNWAINQQYDFLKSEKLRGMVMKTLTSLYAHYASCRPISCENMDDWQDVVESQFERDVSGEVTNDRKNDLDKYLEEAREVNSKGFDILDWWKKRQETYPIISLMARDVLAIPVSTVASESAFSTGGRILDPFRSSLSSKMVQGLVCTQDWLRTRSGPLLAEEYIEELEKIDKELAEEPSSVDDDYY